MQDICTVCWPQARFKFATEWEFGMFKQVMKVGLCFSPFTLSSELPDSAVQDIDRVFGLRELQETLERDIGLPVESLPDYTPLPRDWHPTAPTRGKLLQENKKPLGAGTDKLGMDLLNKGLHVDPGAANVLKSFDGKLTEPMPAPAPPTVFGDMRAATDPAAEAFVGFTSACHCCHKTLPDSVCCPEFVRTHEGISKMGAGKHVYCQRCLAAKGSYDYHAVRTGKVIYSCPACAGMCGCSRCREKSKPSTRLSKRSNETNTASITATAAVNYVVSQAAKDKYAAIIKKCVGIPMPLTEGMTIRLQAVKDKGDGRGLPTGPAKFPFHLKAHDYKFSLLFPDALADPRYEKWAYKYTLSLAPYLDYFGLNGASMMPYMAALSSKDKDGAKMGIQVYQAKDLLPTITSAGLIKYGLIEEEKNLLTANVALAAVNQRRRCLQCKNTESFTSSRRRLIGVHPLVPVSADGQPVLICEHCNLEMLQRRAKAAIDNYLHDGKDGYEDICALCGCGGPVNRQLNLVCCSAQICPRSYCVNCIPLLLNAKAATSMKEAPEWLCPPCNAIHKAAVASEVTVAGISIPGVVHTVAAGDKPATAGKKRARSKRPDKPEHLGEGPHEPLLANGSAEGDAPMAPVTASAATHPTGPQQDAVLYFAHYAGEVRKRLSSHAVGPSEDECFVCKDGGEVVECDCVDSTVRCPKVYHEDCLGFVVPDEVEWACPRHKCKECPRPALMKCRYCPTSLCSVHAHKPMSLRNCLVWPPGTDVGVHTPDIHDDSIIMICATCRQLRDVCLSKGLLQAEPADSMLQEATTTLMSMISPT
jgi:hypothetical protein